MKTITLESLTEPMLEALGTRIAAHLFPGAFLAFFGDLGAGKTTLIKKLIQEAEEVMYSVKTEYYKTIGNRRCR